MDDKRLESQIRFLIELDRMKTIERQSPIYAGGRRENDAEHSWHIAVMAMVLREYAAEPVDMGHVLEMLAVHDLIEIYAGDTFAYDAVGNADKAARENAAADRLYACLLYTSFSESPVQGLIPSKKRQSPHSLLQSCAAIFFMAMRTIAP